MPASNDRPRVVVAEPIHAAGMELLRDAAQVVVPRSNSEPELRRCLADADAVVVRSSPLTGALIDGAARLRVIGRHGVGCDNIDLPAATRRGIPVVYTPGANDDSVAEYVVGAILLAARRFLPVLEAVRAGAFDQPHRSLPSMLQHLGLGGHEVRGKTVGVVGFGRIGRKVARRCGLGLEMRVVAFDPYLPPGADMPDGVERVRTLEVLLTQSHYVTLHVPLTPETRSLINRETLISMRPDAYLINAARGPVVDEQALYAVLRERRVAGAFLDVFSQERLNPEAPPVTIPGLVATPHIAGCTEESFSAMALSVSSQVIALLRGERAPHVANPETLIRA